MTKSTKIIAALGVAAGLGIAALPAGSIFADTLLPLNYTGANTSAEVKVKLKVSEAITIATNKTVCGEDVTMVVKSNGSCNHLIAGGTNAKNGFTISVKDKDTDTSLVNTNGSTNASAKIAAHNGAVDATAGTYGWSIKGGDQVFQNSAAITSADQAVLKTTQAEDKETTMTYNFATLPNQEVGTYEDTIVYTISANS
jgi:hypothetical protein